MQIEVSEKLIARTWAPLELYSENRTHGLHWANKKHHSSRAKEWWKWFRSTESLGIDVIPQGGFKRRLIVRRLYGKARGKGKGQRAARAFDRANFYKAIKPLEDALVRLNWLIDDRDKYVETEVQNVRVLEATEFERERWENAGAVVFVEIFETEVRI